MAHVDVLVCLAGSLILHAYHLIQPFFTERVFQIFDKDNSGSISLQEFIDAIHQFSGQSADDKIRFLFKVYDIDGKYVCEVPLKIVPVSLT